MKLDLIEAFMATLHSGSIRAAAKALHQSQPGVSKKLRQLEAELGVPLITRSQKGIDLTRYGEAFAVRARAILNETDRAVDEMKQLRGELEGAVRIVLAPSSCVDLVPQAVRLFQRDCPQVRLDIYEGLQALAIDQLRAGHIDFAVCPLWEPLSESEFIVEEIERMRMAVVTSVGSRYRNATSLAQLDPADWVHVGAGANISPLVVKIFQQAGLPAPQPRMECYSMTSTLALLVHSEAVALLPAKLAQQPQYRDLLVEVPVRETIPDYPLYIIHRRESPLTPASRVLASTFARVAGARH